MNRFRLLFSDPKRAAETLLSMKCLDHETFAGCQGCAFWDAEEAWGPCPQYPHGTRESTEDLRDLREWLESEVQG